MVAIGRCWYKATFGPGVILRIRMVKSLRIHVVIL